MRQAAALIADLTSSLHYDAYTVDAMVRAAVVRQFEVIGEALGQLAKVDPAQAQSPTPSRPAQNAAVRRSRPSATVQALGL